MCVFDFLFSLPVLVAVAWRFCMTNAQPPKKKRRRIGGKNSLSLSLLTEPKPAEREDCFSWCCFQFVCLRFWLWVCVCYVRSSSILDASGAWICWLFVCVCVFLSQARARSLTFGSLTLSLSRSVSLSPLFLSSCSLSLWSPPQFDYFYQKVLSFIMFCFASFNL